MRTWKHPGRLWFCWSFSRARRRLSAWRMGRLTDRVIGLSPLQIQRRFTAAARAAGIEAHLTAHSGRVGLASELTARGASTTEVMLAATGARRAWSLTTARVPRPNAGPSPSICEAGTGGKTPSKPHQNHVTQELTPRAHHGLRRKLLGSKQAGQRQRNSRPKCYSQDRDRDPATWDRRSTETTKAYAAFRAYIALGARRSVREALRQTGGETAVSGKLRTWEGWSSKNAWVSRADSRDAWLARTADEQTAANIRKCLLALTGAGAEAVQSGDSREFLRAARALSLHFPPIQRVEDVSERIEDLGDLSGEQLDRMREVRDAARRENAIADEGQLVN